MSNSEPRNFWEALRSLTCQRPNFFIFSCRQEQSLMSDFVASDALENWLCNLGEIPSHIPCREECNDCGALAVRRIHDHCIAECPLGKVEDQCFSVNELTFWEYDVGRLHSELIALLPNTVKIAVDPVADFTWVIGEVFRGINKETRKILVSYLEPMLLWNMIPALCNQENNKPVLLFSPYMEDISAAEKQAFGCMKIKLISLQNHFHINKINGYPELIELPEPISEFLAWDDMALLRKTISVPPFTKWSDIRITCLDQYTVNCFLKGHNYTRTYMDFGLVNHRTGKPSSLWWLLVSFGSNNGQLRVEWPNKRKADADQQRKHRLDMALREYFKLGSPAISMARDGGAYQCNFRIYDETHSSVFHRKLRKQ